MKFKWLILYCHIHRMLKWLEIICTYWIVQYWSKLWYLLLLCKCWLYRRVYNWLHIMRKCGLVHVRLKPCWILILLIIYWMSSLFCFNLFNCMFLLFLIWFLFILTLISLLWFIFTIFLSILLMFIFRLLCFCVRKN